MIVDDVEKHSETMQMEQLDNSLELMTGGPELRSSKVRQMESPAVCWIETPDANGACREGTIAIYRFFNNRQDANHRLTPDLSVRRAMNNRSWVPEGDNGVAFCSPI